MIIRRIPMNAVQKAVYSILSTKQSTPVYDSVPAAAVLPYITIGEFTAKMSGAKTSDISDISLTLHIWSEYEGKSEVNGIANDVAAVLTAWPLVMTSDGFAALSQDVDFFESFPEEIHGFHGVLTMSATVQNLGAPH